jgi:putative spermidine/putrescine transport system substrate-binding protein
MSDAAHKFANWQLSGPYGCVLGALRGYMVPTDQCVKLLEKGPMKYWHDINSKEAQVTREQAAELNQHVQRKFSSGHGEIYWQNTRPKNYQLYEKLWSELRAI